MKFLINIIFVVFRIVFKTKTTETIPVNAFMPTIIHPAEFEVRMEIVFRELA